MEPPTQPTYYVVQSGDTLFEIAQRFNTDMDVLLRANQLNDANVILVGTPLAIPGSDGALPARLPITASTNLTEPVLALADRGTIIERMTSAAQNVPRTSPYYKTTWVTYSRELRSAPSAIARTTSSLTAPCSAISSAGTFTRSVFASLE